MYCRIAKMGGGEVEEGREDTERATSELREGVGTDGTAGERLSQR